MYGLVALLSTGVLWAAWEVLEREGKESHALCAVAYVVLTTLALYTQYYAVFLPIGLTLYALWACAMEKRALLRWFGLQIIVALLYLPWVIYAGPRLTLYVSQKVVQDADRPLGSHCVLRPAPVGVCGGAFGGAAWPWWPLALVLLVPRGGGLLLQGGAEAAAHAQKGTMCSAGDRHDKVRYPWQRSCWSRSSSGG